MENKKIPTSGNMLDLPYAVQLGWNYFTASEIASGTLPSVFNDDMRKAAQFLVRIGEPNAHLVTTWYHQEELMSQWENTKNGVDIYLNSEEVAPA